MTESTPRRRRRPRPADSDSIDHLLDSPPETPPPDNSEPTAPALQNNNDMIDSIRSELLEDLYHATLAESDYSDDSHNWSDANYSTDYWHFLGQYE